MRSFVSMFKNPSSQSRGQAATAWGVLCWKCFSVVPEVHAEQAEGSSAGQNSSLHKRQK